MRFTMVCRKVGGDRTWEEPYEKDHVNTAEEAQEAAQGLVDYFNRTLRPDEKRRELVGVKIDEATAGSFSEHDWRKTNLVTVIDRGGGSHDVYRCERCGVTGKRFSLAGEVTHDRKYQAKCYNRCDTAMEQLARLRARRV